MTETAQLVGFSTNFTQAYLYNYKNTWLPVALADEPGTLAEVEHILPSMLADLYFQEAVLRYGPGARQVDMLCDRLWARLEADVFLPQEFIWNYLNVSGNNDVSGLRYVVEGCKDLLTDPLIWEAWTSEKNNLSELGDRLFPHWVKLREAEGMQLSDGVMREFKNSVDIFVFCVLHGENLRRLPDSLFVSMSQRGNVQLLQRLWAKHQEFVTTWGLA